MELKAVPVSKIRQQEKLLQHRLIDAGQKSSARLVRYTAHNLYKMSDHDMLMAAVERYDADYDRSAEGLENDNYRLTVSVNANSAPRTAMFNEQDKQLLLCSGISPTRRDDL